MGTLVAAKSLAGSVGTTSAVLAAENVGRREITVVNTHATNVLSIQLATVGGVAPTATQLSGIVLYPQGSWSSNAYDGACAIIGSAASTTYAISEF